MAERRLVRSRFDALRAGTLAVESVAAVVLGVMELAIEKVQMGKEPLFVLHGCHLSWR